MSAKLPTTALTSRMWKKLISQSFSFAGGLSPVRDIVKLHHRRNGFPTYSSPPVFPGARPERARRRCSGQWWRKDGGDIDALLGQRLKRVDLPTLGRPTMPMDKFILFYCLKIKTPLNHHFEKFRLAFGAFGDENRRLETPKWRASALAIASLALPSFAGAVTWTVRPSFLQ